MTCRVLEGIDMIFHGEISVRQNFRRNPKKSTISCDIYRDISTIFPDKSHGQQRSNTLQCLKNPFVAEGI